MKGTQRLISVLLTAAMAMTALPSFAAADDAAEDAGLAITREGGDVTAAYSGSADDGDTMILTAYDTRGKARDVKMQPLSEGKTVSLPEENGRYYKAFAWDVDKMIPLCKSALDGDAYSGTVELPLIGGAIAESVTAAVRRYGDARMLVDELAALDISDVYGDSKKLSEYMAKVNEAIAAYDDVMQSAAVLNSVAEKSIETETAELAAAAEEVFSVQATKDEQLHWAEEFTQRYDSIKGKDKLKQLAQMMGVDAVEAYSQLVASQNILRGKYMDDAATADAWVKGLTAVKTGAKVGLFVCATVGTMGGAAAAAGGVTGTQAVGIWLGAADATIDIGKTTATIIYGDESKVVKDMDNMFKPVTTAATIFSILTLDTASLGEQLACIYDTKESLNETVKNYTGYTIDDFTNPTIADGKLYFDLISKIFSDEDIDKIVKDTKDIVKDGTDDLLDAKDRLNKDRDELTDDKIEEILKDGDVLEEDETLDDFKDEQDEFEKNMKEESLKEDEEETPEPTLKPNETPKPTAAPKPTPTPKITYHEEETYGGQYITKYYYNHEIDSYVDLYERYFKKNGEGEPVLIDRAFYNEDGVRQWHENYDYTSGELSSRYTYSDGDNLGSIVTEIFYYTKEHNVQLPDGVTEQVQHVAQYIVAPYINDDGEESLWQAPYYGNWYGYEADGALREYSTGSEGRWTKTVMYDSLWLTGESGVKTMEYISNGDGTHTIEAYYYWGEQKGHIWSRMVCYDVSHDWEAPQYSGDQDTALSWEKWDYIGGRTYHYTNSYGTDDYITED